MRKHVKARKATKDQYDQWLIDQDIYWLLVDYLTFWASQWKYAKDMLEPGEGVIYKKVGICITGSGQDLGTQFLIILRL